ncbi:MAG: uroporphyrinogen decarboxylase family protein [Ignavibacteriales bacterium]|nr:uroporphyrinogen decarboxylase family protein [Ignavibacteriales bacterium]
MKLNMNDWKKSIIESKERKAMPVMTHPGIEIIGAKIKDAVQNGTVHYNAVKAVAEKYPSAATTMIMDLSVEAEAFGAEIKFSDNEVPAVISRVVYDERSITNLKVPDLDCGRFGQYITAAKLASENIKDRPVFAGCIGPFSLASRLYDITEIMTALLLEPESICFLLEKCSQLLINYCSAFKKVGANGIFMAEPAAGMLSPDSCTEFSSDFIKKIVAEVQDENFLVILHNCGNTNSLLDTMQSTNAAALHFGNQNDIVKSLKHIEKDKLVLGNIDPARVFTMSDAEQVYNITYNLLEKTSSFKNFILSSGCDIPPNVPMDNIDSFYKALEDYNCKRNAGN